MILFIAFRSLCVQAFLMEVVINVRDSVISSQGTIYLYEFSFVWILQFWLCHLVVKDPQVFHHFLCQECIISSSLCSSSEVLLTVFYHGLLKKSGLPKEPQISSQVGKTRTTGEKLVEVRSWIVSRTELFIEGSMEKAGFDSETEQFFSMNLYNTQKTWLKYTEVLYSSALVPSPCVCPKSLTLLSQCLCR